jgi:hypothetical protein
MNGNDLEAEEAASRPLSRLSERLRAYAGRDYVAHVESVDRPATVPFDQEVDDGLHGLSG